MDRESVYLDHAATTPLDRRVLEAMTPYLEDHFGNASSVHRLGRRARGAIEEAREKVADLLGAEPSEIVFTSGGTEANNLAIAGHASAFDAVVTSKAEHEAALAPVAHLAACGSRVAFAHVESDGTVNPASLADALDRAKEGKVLVTLMHINNEVGAVNDIRSLAEVGHREGAIFHTDAVQSVGLLDTNVDHLGVDMLSLSAHKLYGPKGVGALYVRNGVELDGTIRGGPQERGRRAGSENVAGIVGLARALELAASARPGRADRMASLRDRLSRGLLEALGDDLELNSRAPQDRLAPHIVNVSVKPSEQGPIDGEMLLLNLDMEGVFASSGAACSSGALRPSHVLEAIGRGPALASASLRFSLGKDTSEAELDYTLVCLVRVLRRMKQSRFAG